MDDVWRILFNVVYRLGNVYDLIYEFASIFNWQLAGPYLSDVQWQYVGELWGRAQTEVLYPAQYQPLVIVYPAS